MAKYTRTFYSHKPLGARGFFETRNCSMAVQGKLSHLMLFKSDENKQNGAKFNSRHYSKYAFRCTVSTKPVISQPHRLAIFYTEFYRAVKKDNSYE
jgi:hypothetical protein